MKKIKIENGTTVVVSDEDYDYVKQYEWKFNNNKIVRKLNVKKIYLELEILTRMGQLVEKHMTVEYKDGDRLNNQRENLVLTKRKYKNTLVRARSNNVYYVKKSNKWVARYRLEETFISLGTFDTYEEAILARLAAEKKYDL